MLNISSTRPPMAARNTSGTTCGTWPWRDGTRRSWRCFLLLHLLISHFSTFYALESILKGLLKIKRQCWFPVGGLVYELLIIRSFLVCMVLHNLFNIVCKCHLASLVTDVEG